MRLFIAVFPPPAAIKRLREAMAEFKTAFPKIRWTNAEAAHFTLVFLGDCSRAQQKEATSAMNRAAAVAEGFSATFGGTGAFPSWNHPKIIWAGLKEGTSPLTRLASAVRSELAARHIPFDAKPFVPHLTLARVSQRFPLQGLRTKVTGAFVPTQWPAMAIQEFSLVASQLGKTAPVYMIAHREILNSA